MTVPTWLLIDRQPKEAPHLTKLQRRRLARAERQRAGCWVLDQIGSIEAIRERQRAEEDGESEVRGDV